MNSPLFLYPYPTANSGNQEAKTKKLMRYFLCLFFCLVSYWNVTAQSNRKEVPPWVTGDFPPKSNDSYTFMISEGSGLTLSDAQKDSDLMLVTNLMRSAGVSVTGHQIERVLASLRNGEAGEEHESSYQYNFTYENVSISFRAVDRYWIKNSNHIEMTTLYEVANNPLHVQYDPVEYTTSYGARGLWRSICIPGWGQMYKKQYVKGAIILAAEAALVTSIVIFENQRSAYMSKAMSNFDPNAIQFYNNHANTSKNVRNGFIAGAVALYVYNIVDAIVAKGKIRYNKPSNKFLSVIPYISTESDMGICMSYKF